jgi:sensor c-di-GMP phosphodiesterase-like protein
MRLSLLYSKRTGAKLVAAVLGVLALGMPVVLFDAWLKRQGDDEVSATAAWALASVERQLGQTVAALHELAARGVDSCRPTKLETMRQVALRTEPVKALMLVAPNGQVLCTDSGGHAGRHELLSTAAVPDDDIALDVVGLSDGGDRFLRVRKNDKADKASLAALVTPRLLLPPAMLPGGGALGDIHLTMVDGTLVGAVRSTQDGGRPDAPYRRRMQSKRYGLAVNVAMVRNGVIANYDDLRRISMVVTGLIALAILLFALILFRRKPEPPIADIAKAILANEFEPYYQPVVDIQTGRLLGAEVLVRWRRSDGSLVEPAAFVSVTETSGLMPELTRLLMRRVRDDVGEAFGRRPKLMISFNVATQHFDDALILNDVGTIFDGAPLKVTQIVLELTERREVENLASMRRTIAALQGLGCRIAIDDFGTGHSGLSYILKLGVDIIKIDRMFVEAIATEGHSRAIIETLIDLAKNMRMEIIAEGVETFDQVTYLRERGISAAQGYVFAPPLPASSFLQLLQTMDPVAEKAPTAESKAKGGKIGKSAARRPLLAARH